MNIVTEISGWIKIKNSLQSHSTGLIPTMGNLHEGHLSLCKKSIAENDITVVSIFVNPTQFNNNDDLLKYPRTLEDDIRKLQALNVDYVFAPQASELYPDKYELQVQETHLSQVLEGEFRPGHFTGMLTIVLKLFNLIQPKKAYFGEKDYQQLLLVRKLVSSLFLPVEIVACETVRDEKGLALSSRNNRLTVEQLELAYKFPELLSSKKDDLQVVEQLLKLGFKVEYITKKWQRRLGAVKLGDVRLIDNFKLENIC